ncbi:MAG: hypothetical protein K0B02_05120 [DPANN group archaeon]|nr:hypothetical protein [DPANN group archaeon]
MIKARLSIDDKDMISAIVKGNEIDIDILDYMKVLRTPKLVKIALNLKSISSGKYKVNIKKNFFSNIFGK